MPQRIVGIDIGSYSVKIAEVVRNFRSFAFVGFYERQIQYNELLSPEESVSIALQGLIDDHHLSWDAAVCGFPTQRVSSRLITFPFSGRKKIEEAVRFEVETHIPFSIEEVILDYNTVWSTKEATKVLTVYTRQADFVKYLMMLQNIGVDPRTVSVEAVELINLISLGMMPPEGSYAILDVGSEKSSLSICRGKEVGFIRAISCAGRALTEAIAKRLHVSFDEAEKIKIELGNLPDDEAEEMDDLTEQVTAALGSVVDELLLHIKQTFFTYRNTEGSAIEGLFLCGGSSRLPGFDRYLTDRLKLNVSYLNCTDFHFSRLEHGEGHRHVIPQALALALKGVAPGGAPRINLRKGEFAFKGDVEQIGGSMKYAAGSILVIILLALTYFSLNFYTLKSKLHKVQEDVQEVVRQTIPDAPEKTISTMKGAMSLIKGREVELKDRQEKLQAVMGFSPLDVLVEISSRTPARKDLLLDVEKLTIAADRALLSGATDSFEAVDRLKQALESSPMFRSVSSGNVRKGVKGEVKFDLSLEFKTRAQEEA